MNTPGSGYGQRWTAGKVRMLWIPGEGPVTAALVFRTGQYDEPLTVRGITHLGLHLALHGSPAGPHAFNSGVDGLYTTFSFSGPMADVSTHLQRLCYNLGQLPVEPLEAERQALLGEEARAPGAIGASLLGTRFGALGPGAGAFREFGLYRVGPDEVAQWMKRRFTAANALLWMEGGDPQAMSLDLPDGEAMPPPAPRPRRIAMPAQDLHPDVPGIAISMVGQATTNDDAALRLLQTAATGRLETALGPGHPVGLVGDRLDALSTHWVVFAAANQENAATVRDTLIPALDSAAMDGADFDAIRAEAARFETTMEEPGTARTWLDRAARDALVGIDPHSPAEELERLRRLVPQDVINAVRRMRQGMIVLMPGDSHEHLVKYRFTAVPQVSNWSAAGTEYKPKGRDGERGIIVGEGEITYRTYHAETISVKFATCAAVLVSPKGQWTVIGEDGLTVRFDVGAWRNGAEIAEHLSVRINPRLFIRVPEGPPEQRGAPRTAPVYHDHLADPDAQMSTPPWYQGLTWVPIFLAVVGIVGLRVFARQSSGTFAGMGALGLVIALRLFLMVRRH